MSEVLILDNLTEYAESLKKEGYVRDPSNPMRWTRTSDGSMIQLDSDAIFAAIWDKSG